MCLFKAPKAAAMASPPPVKPRLDTDTSLPAAKPVVDENITASVKYGGGEKKTGPAAAKKTGTDQLKIPLNTGTEIGSKTGGLNV